MTDEYLTDDEQLEQVKRVVAENWAWVVGGIALGAALIFGYRYYDAYQNGRALRAAAQFDDMAAALQRNDPGKSHQIADGLIKDFPTSPYADQAQMVLARLAVDGGQLANAVAPLTEVMTHSKDLELRHVARLRLARVLIDQGKSDEALKTLAEDAGWGSFGSRAHEVRGDAFYAKKDVKSALAEYQAAMLGGETGGVDSALLQLKIADLGTPVPAPAMTMAPAAVTVPTADSSNKAKP